MSLKNIKSNTTAQKGFTIVELLIVVVVIAILAAITIVSYNGITNRANQSAAKSAASTAQKKIELYNSEVGNYPISLVTLSNDATKAYNLPSSAYGTANPTADNGKTYVKLEACKSDTAALTASNINGIRISYWTYGADSLAVGVSPFVVLGTNATCTNAVALNA